MDDDDEASGETPLGDEDLAELMSFLSEEPLREVPAAQMTFLKQTSTPSLTTHAQHPLSTTATWTNGTNAAWTALQSGLVVTATMAPPLAGTTQTTHVMILGGSLLPSLHRRAKAAALVLTGMTTIRCLYAWEAGRMTSPGTKA